MRIPDEEVRSDTTCDVGHSSGEEGTNAPKLECKQIVVYGLDSVNERGLEIKSGGDIICSAPLK